MKTIFTKEELSKINLCASIRFYEEYEASDFTCEEEQEEAWDEVYKKTAKRYLVWKAMNKKDPSPEEFNDDCYNDHSSWE